MKLIQSCANKLIASGVVLLALAWTAELSAQAVKQVKATVSGVKGSARYSMDNRTWQPVKVGMVIGAGAVIQTGPNSHVDLIMGEREAAASQPIIGGGGEVPAPQPRVRNLVYTPRPGERENFLRVTPDSILAIDKLTTENSGTDVVSETQLDLRAGRIIGKVKKMSAASRYEIKFPTGVAGIRGTLYILDASGAIRVLKDSVMLSYFDKNGAPQTKLVVAGYMFDPLIGEPTPIPGFDQQKMLLEFKDIVRDFEQIGGTQSATPSFYVIDNTLYWVSPNIGFSAAPPPPPTDDE